MTLRILSARAPAWDNANNDFSTTTAIGESTDKESSTELFSSSITGRFSNSLLLIDETQG